MIVLYLSAIYSELAKAKLISIFGSDPPDSEKKKGNKINSKCIVSSMLNFFKFQYDLKVLQGYWCLINLKGQDIRSESTLINPLKSANMAWNKSFQKEKQKQE